MKTFNEFQKKVNLIRFIGSDFGTMYFEPDLPSEKSYIIRHLDGELSEQLLPSYINLYTDIKFWIETNPKLKEYIEIPEINEVGKDYIVRPFIVYYKSVRSYFDEDEPTEPEKRYFEMIKVFSEEMLNAFIENEDVFPSKSTVIKRILRKSIFGLSAKTVFNNKINKFLLVEPKISLSDIEQFQSLS